MQAKNLRTIRIVSAGSVFLLLAAFALPPRSTFEKGRADSPFSDAYQVAFNAAANNFQSLKGDPLGPNNYKTTLVLSPYLSSPYLNSGTNIYFRNNMWAFRFDFSGAINDEPDYFTQFSAVIEQVFTINNMKYSKKNVPYPGAQYGLPSVQYTGPADIVRIDRTISGNTFDDEVIIFHRGYAIDPGTNLVPDNH
jgi:hypothetical protein